MASTPPSGHSSQEGDWVAVLRRRCEGSTRAAIAAELGASPPIISSVLNSNYPHDTSRLEGKVRGLYMAATVDCPILAEISRKLCIEHQGRRFAATNPTRVALYRACRRCDHRLTN